MKNCILLFGVIIFTSTLSGQQLPNSGFENWSTSSFTTLEPDHWYSFNMITADYPDYGTIRTTDAYEGTYALKLRSGYISVPAYEMYDTTALATIGTFSETEGPKDGMPFTGRPLKYSFYFKYTPGTLPEGKTDTALVFVKFTKNGANVGGAQWKYWGNAVSQYTKVEVPITWWEMLTPDTVYANFTSSVTGYVKSWDAETRFANVLGNELIIDKFEFIYTPTAVTKYKTTEIEAIYPNPARDIVTLATNISGAEICTLHIYSMVGKLMKIETITEALQEINVKDLPNGIYLINLTSEASSINHRLIINRP